jgi:hypothetical protein
MSSPSPWSRGETPSITVPPPAAPGPLSSGRMVRNEVQPRSGLRFWAWAMLTLIVVAATSAAGGAITYSVLNDATHPPVDSTQPSRGGASSPTTTAQFSVGEIAAAKDGLCRGFDLSVRGQEGQGGVRVAGGDANLPMVLRALNSVSAVQNSLTPAVPADVSAAARGYMKATLDQTTAAMGNSSTSEVNRLTDVRNDAIFALVDACGLPR